MSPSGWLSRVWPMLGSTVRHRLLSGSTLLLAEAAEKELISAGFFPFRRQPCRLIMGGSAWATGSGSGASGLCLMRGRRSCSCAWAFQAELVQLGTSEHHKFSIEIGRAHL